MSDADGTRLGKIFWDGDADGMNDGCPVNDGTILGPTLGCFDGCIVGFADVLGIKLGCNEGLVDS